MKKHFHKNSTCKLSLQWRLTLIITLLVTVTCILMYFFISHSAVNGIENLEDYMIQIDRSDGSGSAPITFSVNPSTLFPGLSDQIESTKALFRTRSIIATVIIILLSSVCTYFISRKALSPLRSLSQRVDQIQAQNLSDPLPVPETNDEISRLTIAFNNMLARLDNAFTAQKQFSANAAHELRTPLAVMQTNLEVFARKKAPQTEEYQQLFAMIQEQTGRLTHLAGVLLDMTGIQTIERSDQVSLAALTDEVFCDLISIAENKKIQLIQKEGDCIVTGSYLLLYRAIYNLVENAIKYNHPGGTVTVRIHSSSESAIVEVADTGIGISPENQEKIFFPFFRVDKARSRATGGAGLGLALVNEIAMQHNGQVKVLKSNEKGTTMAFVMPV